LRIPRAGGIFLAALALAAAPAWADSFVGYCAWEDTYRNPPNLWPTGRAGNQEMREGHL
jgi:hypothetical protein